MELIRNAWTGWMDFNSGGKLAALFLAALIYLWLGGKWKTHKMLYFYAASTTLCCILPLTAAVLMLYQTRTYGYVWLWSLVPMTAVTAWAAVEVMDWLKENFHTLKWKKQVPAAILLFTILMLSSGSVENVFHPSQERRERQQAWEVLNSVKKIQDGALCLWAPRGILAHAREFDGSVQLIYGKDMWDISLNGYTYDTYPDELRDLYLWMENMDADGAAAVKDGERGNIALNGADCVAAALEAGANCILLPDKINPQIVQEIAGTVDAELSQAGGYYLLTR